MFSRVRIAIRFFFVGLAVGVLLAPRSGIETRRLLRQRADRWLNDLLDAATLASYRSGSQADGGRATPRTARGAGGGEAPDERAPEAADEAEAAEAAAGGVGGD